MSGSPHRVLLASAGTGKTYRLTGHFLDLLLRGVEPEAIRDIGVQRLARLGAVRDARKEREHREAGGCIELRPLIGIDQVARVRLCEPRRPGGQDVLQAIQHFDLCR